MRCALRFVIAPLLCLLPLAGGCQNTAPGSFTVATYNIENFNDHFAAHRLKAVAATQPAGSPLPPLIRQERYQNDEDNWEISQVISDPRFDPDILAIQECCGQADLEYFNRRWLNGKYATVIVFPGNSTWGQQLGLMLKPGFEVVEQRDQYYLESNPDGGKPLFARGPAFALVQTPAGYRFWLGVTHQKSKSGNSVPVTQWRNREAVRTRQIMKDLRGAGNSDVLLVGDMNDELGVQEFEQEAGGDTMVLLAGPPGDGLYVATAPLAQSGVISYGGYWNERYRSFIDHAVATESMRRRIQRIGVFTGSLTPVASDHYPVLLRLRAGPRQD